MTPPESTRLVLRALLVTWASGCGPALGAPDLVSGYYRATWIETDDDPSSGVWSTDAKVGFTREFFDALYADPVPLRADAERLEVPEPTAVAHGPAVDPGAYWSMRRLAWTGAAFQARETFEISFCESYHYAWSATILDEETIHVTREGTGCGPGDGLSRIEDNRVDIEYVLVDPCEPPCVFVDDRGSVASDELIPRESRCEC